MKKWWYDNHDNNGGDYDDGDVDDFTCVECAIVFVYRVLVLLHDWEYLLIIYGIIYFYYHDTLPADPDYPVKIILLNIINPIRTGPLSRWVELCYHCASLQMP